MLCYLHYCPKPCAQCAHDRFLARVFPPQRIARSTSVISFGEHVYDNIFHPWEKPFPISSPEQLRQECVARGVNSERLQNSMIWRSGETRWI